MLPGLPTSSDRSADIAVVVEPVREIVEIRTDDERAVYVVEPVVATTAIVPTVLADLTDVDEAAATDGQVLTFDSGIAKWAPATTDTTALTTRVTALEARPVIDSPDDIGAQPAGSYATTGALTAGLASKADTAHTHAVADVTSLQAVLDGKQATGDYATNTALTAGLATKANASHTHTVANVTGLQTVLDNKAALAHTHAVADTTGLQTALDAKQPLDADLTAIAALAPADGSVLARVAGAWSSRTGSQLKTDLVLTKGDVGLGSVDNTSDAAKPVSTATQSALDAKAPLASPTFTGTVTAPRVVTPPVALADATTVATNAALGNHFRVTLGGNRTLGAPTNPVDGQKGLWELIQDGTGNRTLALASGADGFAFGADITSITLSTAAAKRDFLGAVYVAALSRWLVLAFAKGF